MEEENLPSFQPPFLFSPARFFIRIFLSLSLSFPTLILFMALQQQIENRMFPPAASACFSSIERTTIPRDGALAAGGDDDFSAVCTEFLCQSHPHHQQQEMLQLAVLGGERQQEKGHFGAFAEASYVTAADKNYCMQKIPDRVEKRKESYVDEEERGMKPFLCWL